MRRLALVIPALAALSIAACQPREEATETPAADTAEDVAVDADTAALDAAVGAADAESATSEGTAAAPSSTGGVTRPEAAAAQDAASGAPARAPTQAPARQASPLIPLPGDPTPEPDAPQAPQSLPRPDTVMPDTTPDGRPAF